MDQTRTAASPGVYAEETAGRKTLEDISEEAAKNIHLSSPAERARTARDSALLAVGNLFTSLSYLQLELREQREANKSLGKRFSEQGIRMEEDRNAYLKDAHQLRERVETQNRLLNSKDLTIQELHRDVDAAVTKGRRTERKMQRRITLLEKTVEAQRAIIRRGRRTK